MFKSKKSKTLEKFLKEFDIDKRCLEKLGELGVEKKEDMTYLTEKMITSGGFNPIQQQKLRQALEAFNKDKGTKSKSDDDAHASSPEPVQRQPRAKSGDSTGVIRPAKKARAKYTYSKVKDSQINMEEGDTLTILNDNKKWWIVINDRTGEQGEVPSNYLEVVEPEYLDADDLPGGDAPVIPEEDIEMIYEPVTPSASGEIIDEHEYADPDAYIGRVDAVAPKQAPRPNMRRSESVKAVPEPSPLPEDPRLWNATDVLRWLTAEDLKDFKDVFYANGFEGPMLLTLASSSFKAGGFDPDRCDVLQVSLDKLRRKAKPIAQAKVLYNYDAKKASQLSIREGAIIDILDDSSLWWKALDPNTGKEGQVPSNYLEKLESESAPEPEDFQSFPWYKDLDRRHAEQAVASGGVGTFVVRPSQTCKGDHTLTAQGVNGIMNLKIQQRDQNYVLGQFSSRFSSISELIRHHQAMQIKVTGKPPLLLKSPPP